ncbi:zinc finger protein 383-like isoform X2 [Dermacentor albipictus]|uniref:zinc finger protein 383-like isoform X2 n=1 Tax=Dermacentor albipictus TaxID=60249 RepID=UPI0038FCCDF0
MKEATNTRLLSLLRRTRQQQAVVVPQALHLLWAPTQRVPDNGNLTYQQLGCVSSIDHARPSTSRAGMEEASANFEGGATISESTMVHQGNTQHQLAESMSTVFATLVSRHTHMTETKSTGLTLPVYSSSSGDYAVASTSRIGTEKASDSSGNDDRRWCSGGAEAAMVEGSKSGHTPPAFTFGDEAKPSTSQDFFEGASWTSDCSTAISDGSFEDLWNALNSHNDASDVTGYTHVTESGVPSSPPMASSSSVNHAQPNASRAGMEEASAVPENFARNARVTGGTEQRELCGDCGNVSSRPDALHGHAKEHTDDAAQICKACDQSSVKMSKPVEHCRNLTGKVHKCKTCGKQFHCTHHLAQHHCADTDERPYECNMCGKSFRSSYHLKIHKRTHTDERPHKCQICAKSFRQASHLDQHKRTHTDERPYKCQICNKSFRTSSHLDNHKRHHTGEKPYICETCGKSYARLDSLHRHKHAHAEVKPHACEKCGKSFKSNYILKRHVDYQCGNSAFVCEICDRFFMHNSSLLHHHRTKHADKTPYECTQCGCRFTDKETRDRHVCQKERRV